MSNSDNSSQDSNINIWVTGWRQKDAEKEWHISCSGPASPSFILQKINSSELSREQNEYIRNVKTYLKPIDVGLCDLFQEQSIIRDMEGTPLWNVMKEIKVKALRDSDRFIKNQIVKFLNSFKLFKYKCEEFWLHGGSPLYETTFIQFISDLAELCCLTPKCTLAKDKIFKSVWVDFRGLEQTISEPDIRLTRYGVLEDDDGENYEKSPSLVVSVVEVKYSCKVPKKNPRGKPFSRKQPSSPSLSTESTSSDDSSIPSNPLRHRRKKVNPDNGFPSLPIRLPNSSKVLRQHAGKLLFDLHKSLKVTECEIVRMPGMIFNGVEVIFTLLEMRYDHLKKLRENKKLDHEDKAVMYYSSTYDILRPSTRNIVMDYFIKLNNMVGYGYTDTVIKTDDENYGRTVICHHLTRSTNDAHVGTLQK